MEEVYPYLLLEECEPDGDGEADDTPEAKVCAERQHRDAPFFAKYGRAINKYVGIYTIANKHT